MKNIFLAFGLVIFISSALSAQDSFPTVSKNKYFQTDIGIGYFRMDMNKINSSLKSLGYLPVSENYTTLSLSPSFVINRFVFRGEGSLILPNTVTQPNNRETTFNGYAVGASVGYVVMQKPGFRLFPYVGITGFNTALKFRDLAPVQDLEEVVNTSHNNATLRFSNAAFDLGIQFDRIIALKNRSWDCPQNNRYMTIGLRAGYNWSPGSVKARYNNSALANGPEYKYQGPYLKLVIGVGSKMRQLQWK